jgi:hypothetical protein
MSPGIDQIIDTAITTAGLVVIAWLGNRKVNGVKNDLGDKVAEVHREVKTANGHTLGEYGDEAAAWRGAQPVQPDDPAVTA